MNGDEEKYESMNEHELIDEVPKPESQTRSAWKRGAYADRRNRRGPRSRRHAEDAGACGEIPALPDQRIHQNIDKLLNGALYSVAYDEMVIVKDIEMFSMCEHHLLPFFGRCHVAYVPNGKVIGLSKIPRIVDVFARRLQVQERLTVEIAQTIMDKIKPHGVGVIIEARHLCMIMRGVEKQNSTGGDFPHAGGISRQRKHALGIPSL